MIDKDGSITYSAVISVSFKQKQQANLTVVPNPVLASINLQLTDMPPGAYLARLHNATGQVFFNKTITVNSAAQLSSFPRNNIPAGIYWISISDSRNLRVGSIKVVLE